MTNAIEITCFETWRTISDFIDGSLDTEMHERLTAHLRHCAHCRAVHDGTRNAIELLADERIYDLPTGFSERVLQRLVAEHGAP